MSDTFFKLILGGIFIYPASCLQGNSVQEFQTSQGQFVSSAIISDSGNSIGTRFLPPEHYERLPAPENSFAEWLRNLPLKPAGSKVHFYNGGIKLHNVYEAVIDLDTGDQNLQQCADAVMRLRAEYLFAQKKYDEISFNFTSGFAAEYSKWRKGYRVIVQGNQCNWVLSAAAGDGYNSFRKYLDIVFTYAGTLSLQKQLKLKDLKKIKPGDVFIHGGSPGHAVIVTDVVKNGEGSTMFMLAQSYMPAQDIHILKNELHPAISPWYKADFSGKLITPEWEFGPNELMGW